MGLGIPNPNGDVSLMVIPWEWDKNYIKRGNGNGTRNQAGWEWE